MIFICRRRDLVCAVADAHNSVAATDASVVMFELRRLQSIVESIRDMTVDR